MSILVWFLMREVFAPNPKDLTDLEPLPFDNGTLELSEFLNSFGVDSNLDLNTNELLDDNIFYTNNYSADYQKLEGEGFESRQPEEHDREESTEPLLGHVLPVYQDSLKHDHEESANSLLTPPGSFPEAKLKRDRSQRKRTHSDDKSDEERRENLTNKITMKETQETGSSHNTQIICPTCSTVFSHKGALINHARACKGVECIKGYKRCTNCNGLIGNNHFAGHAKLCTFADSDGVPCGKCTRLFASEKAKNIHTRNCVFGGAGSGSVTSTGIVPAVKFKCENCEGLFTTRKAGRSHMKICDDVKAVNGKKACSKCMLRIPVSGYSNHKRGCHGPMNVNGYDDKMTCPDCDAVMNKISYNLHKKKYHPKKKLSEG